jgi:diaminohydroxyphosphoribosylaminopyrimidine deaminase / 5-amino-6-(5-phosphoribosylamino)uracil reductase
MNVAKADERFMRVALDEAKRGFGRTSPNPAVGAVLVCRGRILARGHHARAGGPHAEIECLRKLGGPVPSDATLYVTLEPCSTIGKTPACTRSIIDAGVRAVVIGAVDVNPRHGGRGISELRKAGVAVRTGVLAGDSERLNEGFNKWIVTRRPFVIAKCGMSLDGRLTRAPSEPRSLTSAASRAHARRLRATVDAILVGAETIRRDNPRLTLAKSRRGRQPWRVIVTRSGQLPAHARVFRDAHRKRTLVYRKQSLRAVLADLGRRKITSILIEGGGDILSQALEQRLIDKVQIYLAPIFTGGNVLAFAGAGANSTADSVQLEEMRYEPIGDDICITGYPKRASQLQFG